MGAAQVVVRAGVGHRHRAPGIPERPGPRQAAQPFADIVQKVGLAFRPEERTQEFAAGPCVVLDPGAVLLHELDVARSGRPTVEPLEQREGDVAVAEPSDEPREALHPHIERVEKVAFRARKQRLPQGEAGAQPPHLTVEAVKALG